MVYKIKTPKAKDEKNTYVMENEYDKQADNFLKETNTKFTIKKIGTGKYFPDDKDERDIYRFTLTKDGKTYSGKFGQSIDGTMKGETPRAYDVLASLSADYGEENTYEEFADNYGYDRDSHSSRKVFKLVQKEREGLKNLYSEEELNKLGEIR